MADNPKNTRTVQIPGVSDEEWEQFKELAREAHEVAGLGELFVRAMKKAYAKELALIKRMNETKKELDALREAI
jgi:hypothetical protein